MTHLQLELNNSLDLVPFTSTVRQEQCGSYLQ